MEKISTEYDPMTNTWKQAGFQDDKMLVKTFADIEPNIEHATKLRNSDEYWKEGVKKGWAHAAHIPVTVVTELLGIGVNVYKDSAREIVAGIKKLNYDHLLTTRKRV